MKGLVTKSTGSWYRVRTGDAKVFRCRIKGKFRLHGKNLTNPVAVGDNVLFNIVDKNESTGIITEIGERKNYIVRQSPRKKHSLHLMASNIDQAMLVLTILQPNLKPGFIDRFLLMTEPHDIPLVLLFNKSDLYGKEEWEIYEALSDIYSEIGYRVLSISATEGENLGEVYRLLQDKTTLISGQSGVGKSTILNKLFPDLVIETDELSTYTGKGQHTTTFARMYPLQDNIRVVDTPGIKTLSFLNLTPQDVRHNFREFFQYSKNCKFSDCTHINEPHCAVKEAIVAGEISGLRYENYLKIIEEIESQNRWERHDYY